MLPRWPANDGWGWFYRAYERFVAPRPLLRRLVRAYFLPSGWELAQNSRAYRRLGVHLFGRVIPTGGINIRRWTGSRMQPYTLSASTPRAAGQFFYKTCVFEALHLPFVMVMLGLSAHRLVIGRPDLALENLLVNLLFNGYPILHHRHTRARIVRILGRLGRQLHSPV